MKRESDEEKLQVEMAVLNRLIREINLSMDSLTHSTVEDDFDFVNNDRTWALEVTQVLSAGKEEYLKYQGAKEKGKPIKRPYVPSLMIDEDGDALSYYGGTMDDTRDGIEKAIEKKDQKARSRKAKEPSFTRIDLAIYVPDNLLFGRKKSIYHLNEFINQGDFEFGTIIVLYELGTYTFDGKTGALRFIEHKPESRGILPAI